MSKEHEVDAQPLHNESPLLPTKQLILDIEQSEIDYMVDRMRAIQGRSNNPEGIDVQKIGHATCFYSETMPWANFNTVKGITDHDIDRLDDIITFYEARDRKTQFEIVPTLVGKDVLRHLSNRGYYQSDFHASLYIQPPQYKYNRTDQITIREIQATEFDLYATIHCRGAGLGDDGISYVAANNQVLYNRPGWTMHLAELNEVPAAVGVMYINKGIASFTFAATLPEFRHRGLQQSLLRSRIEIAALHSCRLAVSQCTLSSQSHRNMERVGMKLAYTRATWTSK